MGYRFIILLVFFFFWRWSQSVLSTDIVADKKIIDRVHYLTIPVNSYLKKNRDVTANLLVWTSFLIDVNVILILAKCAYKGDYKTLFILMAGLIMRQLCQFVNRLPIPETMIWFDPGVTSLLVTYEVSNDFFFSGHTFIAVLVGLEIAKNSSYILKLYGILFMVLEILFVLVTHGHYFMDIYAAIATYFMMKYFVERLEQIWKLFATNAKTLDMVVVEKSK